MIIEPANISDAAEILALQKLAYFGEAEIYSEFGIPPLTQTFAEILADFDRCVFLKTSADDKIIGSVRAYPQFGTCFIGRLIVHPDYQNRGIGTRLMHEIEQQFAGAERYELFTGHLSERNLHLYHKLGYQPFRTERVTDSLSLIYLEKTNPARI
jgi:ribosomal protein S18 acetylase RimI-like enzyme